MSESKKSYILRTALELWLRRDRDLLSQATEVYGSIANKDSRYARQIAVLIDVHAHVVGIYADALEKAKEKGL